MPLLRVVTWVSEGVSFPGALLLRGSDFCGGVCWPVSSVSPSRKRDFDGIEMSIPCHCLTCAMLVSLEKVDTCDLNPLRSLLVAKGRGDPEALSSFRRDKAQR